MFMAYSDYQIKRLKNVVIFSFFAIVIISCNQTTKSPVNEEPAKTIMEPQFVKNGELLIISKDKKDTIKKINIEIADEPEKREQGLMYRKTMADLNGMLFIIEKSEPQYFWMKNTILPLDIIFIDENKEIVTIQQNMTPYSEQSIPSYKNSMYVLEVNAGFCGKYSVKTGDIISYTRI